MIQYQIVSPKKKHSLNIPMHHLVSCHLGMMGKCACAALMNSITLFRLKMNLFIMKHDSSRIKNQFTDATIACWIILSTLWQLFVQRQKKIYLLSAWVANLYTSELSSLIRVIIRIQFHQSKLPLIRIEWSLYALTLRKVNIKVPNFLKTIY